jgi:hypothetical protein
LKHVSHEKRGVQKEVKNGPQKGHQKSHPRIPTIQVQDVKHQLLERFNDRCALASTTLGSLSDIEDDLKGECLDIFSDVS